MVTYGDIYSDINRDKIRKPNSSEIPTGSTTKNDLEVREFVEIVVEYPPEDLCTYPEYKGKPYFSIKYEEGNDCIIGYGTYNPQVLSRYLKDYFMPTTKNNLGVDCISRADVNQVIEDYMDEQYHVLSDRTRERAFGAKVVKARINELPSVTPQEPKTGHWIVQPSNKEQGERDFIWWKCSECGQVIFSETEHDRLKFHAFCGRCGSDNREVVEE
jgi:hypothetical protein